MREALDKQEKADDDCYGGNFQDANQVGMELGFEEGKLSAYQEILSWLKEN